MRLQALVFCADEKILRVIRRVLSDLEISVDHCAEGDAAIHKLTRQRYEAVIVDCANDRVASQVLRSARTAMCNKRAVAVAILEGDKATKSVFDLGAHFVLYKPISSERAKASFRAARALMKRERRRNTRIPVEIPVTLVFQNGEQQRTVTADLSEGGIAIQQAPRAGQSGPMSVRFILPGADFKVDCVCETAWTNSSRNAGLRFVDPSAELRTQLNAWLERHMPEPDQDDPPTACKLTDLSPGGGYLESPAPFPMRTKVTLSIQASGSEVKIEGVVRVSHPEAGMGIEFARKTLQQQLLLEKFIHGLISSGSDAPEIMVQPEGLEEDIPATLSGTRSIEDPLLDLFLNKAALPTDAFLVELSKQRGAPAETTA